MGWLTATAALRLSIWGRNSCSPQGGWRLHSRWTKERKDGRSLSSKGHGMAWHGSLRSASQLILRNAHVNSSGSCVENPPDCCHDGGSMADPHSGFRSATNPFRQTIFCWA
ncbi:hypothetical protein B0T16DRAFT_107170 [Cercophora newfieldiana]|uniref:Uncharacterized protein n=1 Tax=Cercophora newfieldiana TaxID=92897 RepID=A0AA39YHX8_9PEZI|nr:hypothetical protein B0T16DRAFT_107170 [Cercophora newfieldiana]